MHLHRAGRRKYKSEVIIENVRRKSAVITDRALLAAELFRFHVIPEALEQLSESEIVPLQFANVCCPALRDDDIHNRRKDAGVTAIVRQIDFDIESGSLFERELDSG